MKTMNRLVLFGALLGLAGTLLAFDKPEGKRYLLSLHEATKVGTFDLVPGEYHIVLGPSKIHIVELDSGKALEVQGTIHTVEKKFSDTAFVSKKIDGATHLTEVQLGGSKTKVTFP
jgi:hypothetical protein